MVERNMKIGTVMIGSMLMAASSEAALDFDVEAEYLNNFTELRYGAQTTWKATSGQTAGSGVDLLFGAYVKTEVSGATMLARYNTGNLLTETLEFDYWIETMRVSQPGVLGLVSRIQSNNRGINTQISFLGTTSVQVQMFYGGLFDTNNNGTGQVAFYDATFNLANATLTNAVGTGGTSSTNALAQSTHVYPAGYWSAINPMHIALAQTSGVDPTFNLTISDGQGLVATTGMVPFVTNDDYNGAGMVGFRIGSAGGTVRSGLDNFSVPEPGAAVLLGVVGAGALARRRRA